MTQTQVSSSADIRSHCKWRHVHCWWSQYNTPLQICPMLHYNDVIIGAIASQITSLTIVYSIVYSDADQRKHLSSASLALVRGIHRGQVTSPHKWPVTRKMFPFDDVIMFVLNVSLWFKNIRTDLFDLSGLFVRLASLTLVVTVEVWEWISNFASNFTGHVITYPCWA